MSEQYTPEYDAGWLDGYNRAKDEDQALMTERDAAVAAAQDYREAASLALNRVYELEAIERARGLLVGNPDTDEQAVAQVIADAQNVPFVGPKQLKIAKALVAAGLIRETDDTSNDRALAGSELIDPTEIRIANVFQEELEWFDRQDWDGINRSEYNSVLARHLAMHVAVARSSGDVS